MHAYITKTQEPERESRTEKVAIAVTATEKSAVRAIAAIRNTDESNLVRTNTIADIVAEFERIRVSSGAL